MMRNWALRAGDPGNLAQREPSNLGEPDWAGLRWAALGWLPQGKLRAPYGTVCVSVGR